MEGVEFHGSCGFERTHLLFGQILADDSARNAFAADTAQPPAENRALAKSGIPELLAIWQDRVEQQGFGLLLNDLFPQRQKNVGRVGEHH